MSLDEMYEQVFGLGSTATDAQKIACLVSLLRDMHRTLQEIRDRLPAPANAINFSNLPGWN